MFAESICFGYTYGSSSERLVYITDGTVKTTSTSIKAADFGALPITIYDPISTTTDSTLTNTDPISTTVISDSGNNGFVPIHSTSQPAPRVTAGTVHDNSSDLNLVAAIVVPVVLAIIAMLAAGGFLYWRQRRQKHASGNRPGNKSDWAKSELPANSVDTTHSKEPVEADSSRPLFELDAPVFPMEIAGSNVSDDPGNVDRPNSTAASTESGSR